MDSYESAAIANYASQVSTTILTQDANKDMQKEAQKHADKAALEAYQRDINFWNMQNTYNSPLAKRQRLEAAGISPWAEYGQMSNEADSVKSPIADTITPPYINVRMPELNFLSDYMGIKRMKNEAVQLDMALQTNAIENEYKSLQNEALKFFINNEMQRDSNAKALTQQEDRIRFNQLAEEHAWKLKEFERAQEQYEWSKDHLRPYDLTARRLGIEQMQKELNQMELQMELMSKESIMLDQELKNRQQDYKIGEETYNQSKIRTAMDARDWSILEQNPTSLRTDPWYIKKLDGMMYNIMKGWEQFNRNQSMKGSKRTVGDYKYNGQKYELKLQDPR